MKGLQRNIFWQKRKKVWKILEGKWEEIIRKNSKRYISDKNKKREIFFKRNL